MTKKRFALAVLALTILAGSGWVYSTYRGKWGVLRNQVSAWWNSLDYPVAGAQPEDPNSVKLGVGAAIGKRFFPDDNPWNQDISQEQVDPLSNLILERIGLQTPVHPEYGTFYRGAPNGIPYMVVSGDQPKVPITFSRYGAESDPGPYPIPLNAPIEGGPDGKGDRHVCVLDRDNWKLYELFDARPNAQGGWTAAGGAIFDLKSNKLRTQGWSSCDAAGLPILPGLVRYDEVHVKKEINHALRFTVARTRKAFVPPATHYASFRTQVDFPPMGARFRLRANFDMTGYPDEVKVVLHALQKYGMIVADNGGDMFISGAPDPRWNDLKNHEIKKVRARDFEVLKMKNMVID